MTKMMLIKITEKLKYNYKVNNMIINNENNNGVNLLNKIK